MLFVLDIINAIVNAWQASESISAKNSLPSAFNKMPIPSGEQTEEEFIGKFMADKKMQSEFPDHKQRAAVAYEKWGESKNAAINASPAVEVQAIESVDVTVPVIRADVLVYAPGELGNSTEIGRRGAKVYYSPEAISDPDFFETVMRSPYSIGTHEVNTNENNVDAKGWSREVWFDDKTKTTYAKGYVIGSACVEYVKDNKLKPGFGTSAFIKFLELKNEQGVTPDGKEYTAIATKISCSHLAILENIRDRKNVIVAVNALNDKNDLTEQEKNNNGKISGLNAGGNMADEKPIDKEALKNAAKEALNEEKEAEKTKTFNERLDKLESMMAEKNAKNADEPDEDDKKKEAGNAKNEDKKDEDSYAKNALPSQDMIKDISELFGIQFKQTPSLKEIGHYFGVESKAPFEMITAINAKRAEMKAKIPAAVNSVSSQSYTLADLHKELI